MNGVVKVMVMASCRTIETGNDSKSPQISRKPLSSASTVSLGLAWNRDADSFARLRTRADVIASARCAAPSTGTITSSASTGADSPENRGPAAMLLREYRVMEKRAAAWLLAGFVFAAGLGWTGPVLPAQSVPAGAAGGEWPAYAGDLRNQHYSPLDQITAANFNT